MKKRLIFVFIMSMLFACKAQDHTDQSLTDHETLQMVVASDLHYLAPSLYQDCEWFDGLMLKGDGKMVTYADEILDAFQKDMEKQRPDLIILTGDLTFNGEKASHEALAEKLKKLKEQGIAVAVLPGNHDIDSVLAQGYTNEGTYHVEAVDAETFQTIYASLGYDQAYHQHRDSLSYSLALNDDYTLILLDTNAHTLTGGMMSQGGYLSDSTMEWLENELVETKHAGKKAIVAMHHNLALHFDFFDEGYTIDDYETLATLFKTYEVPFVLSGHMHCQHIAQIQGIYDIASSSLLVAPLQYGVITLHDKAMDYHTQSLQISVNANDYFDFVSTQKFQTEFATISDEKIGNAMMEVAVKANRYVFAGNMSEHIEELKQMEGYPYYTQIQGKQVEFYQNYLDTMMKITGNHQSLHIEMK